MKWSLPVSLFILLAFVLLIPAMAQEIQVSRQNKTIAVTAEESITVDPEVATIVIGYHNYGLTKDAALEENVRISNQVTHALVEANVPKENIETRKLTLRPVEPEESWTPEMKKERHFEANQSWAVRVPVKQVNPLVGVATQAGVNEIDDVFWNVIDPVALQAKASGAALVKARSIAEQMAKGLGAKLGDLVYASNKSPAERDQFIESFWQGRDKNLKVAKSGTQLQVEIYPHKVKSVATVYAVFAIE